MKMRVVICLLAAAGCTQYPEEEGAPSGSWELVWSDEFDGPADTRPDPASWKYDIGGHGWGNGQLEFNTDQIENARIDGEGSLVITAMRQKFGNNDYTSARINTHGKFEQTYGRFEARIRLPEGQGIWPAFWMLGANFVDVGWPEAGELDIAEARGSQPSTVYGSAHGPGFSAGNARSAAYDLPAGQKFRDGFHEFAIEWTPDRVAWFVDGEPYHALVRATMPADDRWVFDTPMFIILDVAVGGSFSGDPDETTPFPQSMYVDYVRVYREVP